MAPGASLLAFLIFALVVGTGGEAETKPGRAASSTGSYLREEDYRVAKVAFRLGVTGRPHCRDLLPLTGLFLHYLPEYDAQNRAQAIQLYGVDRGPGILSVVADSPAAKAGLKAGDVLLALNGRALPTGGDLLQSGEGKSWRTAVVEVETLLEEQLRAGPVSVRFLRDGRELEAKLNSISGCPVRSRLARSNQANAFADGRTAIMTTRMLGFVANEDELAVVLAHEAAHNILGHPGQLEAEKVPKGFLGNFGANAARVRETEEEADRLGLKLLWSAGYRTSAAIPFWQRLYRTFDPIPTPKFFSRHPSLNARKRIVEETLAELNARR